MTEDEKKAFLKRMGYSGSCLHNDVASPQRKEKEKRKDNLVDKEELLKLNRLFNQKK